MPSEDELYAEIGKLKVQLESLKKWPWTVAEKRSWVDFSPMLRLGGRCKAIHVVSLDQSRLAAPA